MTRDAWGQSGVAWPVSKPVIQAADYFTEPRGSVDCVEGVCEDQFDDGHVWSSGVSVNAVAHRVDCSLTAHPHSDAQLNRL